MNEVFLRRQSGMSIVEMTVAVLVTASVLVALGSSLRTYSLVTDANLHQSQALEQARLILDGAANEILQTTTEVAHSVTSDLNLPLSSEEPDDSAHPAYNFPLAGVGELHDTLERDGVEYWHAAVPDRMFWIYGTYDSFDTFEFRTVKIGASAGGVSDFMSTDGELTTPWSRSRKIFQLDDRVVMRIQRDVNDPNDFKDVVLGVNVRDLEFHLDADGNVLMYVETISGEEPASGNSSALGAVHQEQRVITPLNDL